MMPDGPDFVALEIHRQVRSRPHSLSWTRLFSYSHSSIQPQILTDFSPIDIPQPLVSLWVS